MECEDLKAQLVAHFSDGATVSATSDGSCRVQLPILEPSGDFISVFVEPRGDRVAVHDGGHIRGLLFDVGPSGPSTGESGWVRQLAEASGFRFSLSEPFVATDTEPSGVSYWVFELARLIGTVASTVPVAAPPRRRAPRYSRKVATLLAEILNREGLAAAVELNKTVIGITRRTRHVDVRYLRREAMPKRERWVYVLTANLGVQNPLGVAERLLTSGMDLMASAGSPLVRAVFATLDGPNRDRVPDPGRAWLGGLPSIDRAERLRSLMAADVAMPDLAVENHRDDLRREAEAARAYLKAAARPDQIETYELDSNEDRSVFLERTRQELASVSSGIAPTRE